MNPHYVYIPFDSNWDQDEFFAAAIARVHPKSSAREHHPGAAEGAGANLTPLAGLPDDATLIIVGHGDNASARGRSQISVQKNHGGQLQWRDRTANNLAAQLRAEGLPRTHKVIKLLMCWGGGDWHWNFKSQQYQTSFERFFASHLASALGRNGYRRILVGGPVGKAVTTNDPDRSNVIKIGVVANGLKKWYLRKRGTLNDSNEIRDRHERIITSGTINSA